MNKIHDVFHMLLCGFLFFSSVQGQRLYNLKTDDLNMIYYSSTHSYIVPHLARSFINTESFYKDFWDYEPSEQVTIFIEDFADWSNGGASAVPRNFVYISISPYMYILEVAPANERMSLLMNHELVHLMAVDKAAKRERFWRKVYHGKIQQTSDNPLTMLYAYQTAPRKFSPRWYHEGIAVFMETWMSGGVGRALGAYDEMVFRTMVHDSAYIYNAVGLESEGTTIDFQVGANNYLYGTRFFNYLGSQYGPEKLVQWVSRTENSKRYFSKQFKEVFGLSLDDEWSNWIAFEHDWQEANLKALRKNPITQYRPIVTDKILGSVSRSFYNQDAEILYTAVKYPGQVAYIAAIDVPSGKMKKMCDVKGASTYYTTNLLYDESAELLFFTTDNYKYRDLNVVNIKTKKVTRLITDMRAGDLAWNATDRSIWGVRHENGISTIVKVNPPYADWTAIHAFPYGTDCYDLDISPNGKYLTGALTFIDGTQKLVRFSIEKLESGANSYEVIFDFDLSSPANFVYSEDGRFIYGTSYYSGVSNVYRYDFDMNDMSILTNGETGFFKPVPTASDSLITFVYTASGFIPVWVKDEPIETVSAIKFLGQEVFKNYPIVSKWNPGSPAEIDLEQLITYKGDYSIFGNTKLKSMVPVLEGYKDFMAMGYRFNISDDIGFNNIDITVSYTPSHSLMDDEKLHLGLNYRYSHFKLNITYNKADFYDLFGPTKTSRKGYSAGIRYDKNLIYDTPRTLDMDISAGYFGGLEVLPESQNVSASFNELYTGKVSLKYEHVKNSQGSVDDEKGYKTSIFTKANIAHGKTYPLVVSNINLGWALPINHSSIWLRSSFGYSPGKRSEPFANFYFGGFGNNWIDRKEIKRYHEYYAFPGVNLNSIGGTNFGKLITELNLPPIRYKNIGIPAFYLRWTRTSLFTSGIITNINSSNEKLLYYNAGIQMDFRFVLLSLLKSSFSIGYAVATEKGGASTDEIMISLKIL